MSKEKEIAKFFYGFFPMDDYPEDQAIEEYAKAIGTLPKNKSNVYTLFSYLENACDENNGHAISFTEIKSKVKRFDKPNASENSKYVNARTPYGTLYNDIARFLMALISIGMLNTCEDNEHYYEIALFLDAAPEEVTHLLSVATENALF